ncbi:hypothetical protein SCLCIDRAFT_757087 [Scleroderma citrinum Foug A]|uniref:Uncharacterized protein n=1 Tax=Scleroderma citrinum Foug A TaxID=1036808 RepID=A0A0C3E4N9_9AGAM|nr:hypothetical protein SCLCIDRAFT_757087 [Scleroderma citrinum Foug A]
MAFDFRCRLSPRGHVFRQTRSSTHPDFNPKSSYWFNVPSSRQLLRPSVPPLPFPYRPSSSPTCVLTKDPDPFCGDVPSHPRLGSQNSWPISSADTHPTMSAWSFPPTQRGGTIVDIHAKLLPPTVASRPTTPAALYTVQILCGYRYTADPEKDIVSLAVNRSGVNISYTKFASLLSIWVPVSVQYIVVDAGAHCNAVISIFGTQHHYSFSHSNPNRAIRRSRRTPVCRVVRT